MKRIPRGREVEQSLVVVVREVKAALKDLNQQAASLMERGDYDGAMAMAKMGRLLSGFQAKVSALRSEWRALRSKAKNKGIEKEETTPLWKYFQPIAKALLELGGRARRHDLEKILASLLEGQFLSGDLAPTARGVPRWKVMVRRARRPMVSEGFLEEAKGPWWRITTAGRRLAHKDLRGRSEK